ncbi:MAG: NAD-dependent DNA ligase LigA [Lachnospiraceae bacterium]|nr:NAD-dependent DNA ligase LigA [Lachnospiraceae bacterium]
MDDIKRMDELIRILNEASYAYYQTGTEIMPNHEYDALYDELLALEEKTGMVRADSPTVKVGYEVMSELPKERHPAPMLSLDKTKDVDALAGFLAGHEGVLSWKMDGLTVVLTYENHELLKAVTRGNGEVGEVITPNAKTFLNVPKKIPFSGRLILRGEAVIRYDDFDVVNASLPEGEEKYKNPRNLCSGSVRQLNSAVTAARRVRFYAFALISAEEDGSEKEFTLVTDQFDWLAKQGFDVVEHYKVTSDSVPDQVKYFAGAIKENPVPSDGLVLTLNDIAYGRSLGRTAKFPRNAIAFKWADETAETTLREIFWSPSRTGRINPVAVFDPVELEGTTVTRASVHNVSIVEQLKLGIGDTIRVYKANMIIPQIAENLTGSGKAPIPDTCPICGAKTQIREENSARELYCPSAECPIKHLKAFALFVSRDALNVDGLSEATLEKLIGCGALHTPDDLFHLKDTQKERVIALEGIGEKSFDNLTAAIEAARETTPAALLYGLGIAGIGPANAKVLCRAFGQDLLAIADAKEEDLAAVSGIGPVLAASVRAYMSDEENLALLKRLLAEVHFPQVEENAGEQTQVSGKTFVITGSLNSFENRKQLVDYIESLGGKVSGSVSANTDYLINNDTTSSSSKNKKAAQLGVPVISEEEFLALAKTGAGPA